MLKVGLETLSILQPFVDYLQYIMFYVKYMK
jgi:hypothetical protein